MFASNFIDDSFGAWLVDHQEYASYIQMDWPDDMANINPRKDAIVKFLAAYQQFMKADYQDMQPVIPEFPQMELFLTKEQVNLSRIHFFLQWKIYRAKCKSRAKALEFANIFIDELKKAYYTSSSQIIMVNSRQFFNAMMMDSAKCRLISSKDYEIVSQINVSLQFNNSLDAQKQYFHGLLDRAIKEFGTNTYYNTEIEIQEEFNSFIFNPAFVYAKEVLGLFTKVTYRSTHYFTAKIVDAMNIIISQYEINESAEVAVFSILFFRAIFNFAISFFPDFFMPKMENVISKYKLQLSLDDLLACQDVFPREQEANELIKTDPYLSRASQVLFNTIFMNSPLDVLSTFHEALSLVRSYAEIASEQHGFDYQSFDAVFGIFLLVFVRSEIPNYEELFWFVLNFSPVEGLASPLEYAKATITAIQLQITKLISTKTEKQQ